MFLDTPIGRMAEDKLKNTGSPKSLVTPEWARLSVLRARLKRVKNRSRAYKHAEELRKLEEAYAAGEFHRFNVGEIEGYYGTGKVPLAKNYTPEFQQLSQLRSQQKLLKKKWKKISDVLGEFDDIMSMQKQVASLEGASAEGLKCEFEERYKAFMEKVATTDFGRGLDGQVGYTLDNRIAFRQEPPLLYWDRRRADPLKADVEEFYPKSDMALLDLQPRPLWPILRDNYPENYDVLEYILSTLLVAPRQSIRDGFQSLAPGAFEWLIPECPSITDIKKGGNPHLDAMTVRCLNVDMYMEIVEAWIKWPFRPTRNEILSRMGSDIYDPDPVEMD
jgi:transcription factor 1